MKLRNILLTLSVVMISILITSCGDDATDPNDNNNNNNNNTLTFNEISISGKLQSFSLATMSLVPWSKGAGTIQARANNSKSIILGTGTLNADGTFNLTFSKTLSTTYFTPFANYKSVWGNGVNYTPADGQATAQMSIGYVAITSNGTTNVETQVSCVVMNNLVPVQKWYPVVYTAAGTNTGTDLSGNVYDCTFAKGWSFFGVYYDMPTKGKMKYVNSATIPANVVWQDGL